MSQASVSWPVLLLSPGRAFPSKVPAHWINDQLICTSISPRGCLHYNPLYPWPSLATCKLHKAKIRTDPSQVPQLPAQVTQREAWIKGRQQKNQQAWAEQMLSAQAQPSLALNSPCLLPWARTILEGLLLLCPCPRIPEGFSDPGLPCFPMPGPRLGRAFSRLSCVSHGQTVNNSTEH